MSDGFADWVIAVNECPYCAGHMPNRTDEDYQLASSTMGGAWSKEFGRITTGYVFSEYCPNCGEFLTGVEYRPELVRVDCQSGDSNVLVFDSFVAWYG
jgi:hypothetical protein